MMMTLVRHRGADGGAWAAPYAAASLSVAVPTPTVAAALLMPSDVMVDERLFPEGSLQLVARDQLEGERATQELSAVKLERMACTSATVQP
jgi:hypothetical protein